MAVLDKVANLKSEFQVGSCQVTNMSSVEDLSILEV